MKIAFLIISSLCLCNSSAGVDTLTPDQKVIAMTILGEARGEGYAGMYAVACVIQQRMKERNKTGAQVCLKNNGKVWQFSCWNPNDPNRRKLTHLLNTPEGYWAKRIAVNIGKLNSNYVKQANHYCNIKSKPYWAKNKKPIIIIGDHKFYRLGK